MKPHCLVIGGTRGLGREVVRLFRDDGRTVSVIGRRPPPEADLPFPGVQYWTADISQGDAFLQALDAIIQAHGGLHHVVFLQRFKGEGDKWAGEIETSLTATRNAVEAVTGRFADSGDRSIVVVSSIADQFIADGQPVGYHVAKAGLHQLACYYAVALGPRGIRVNCVAPCTFVKDENRAFYDQAGDLREVFRKAIPLNRMGTAIEIAHVIEFLCSPKASFVTGQRIAVDGGVSLVSQESLARRLAGV